MQRAKASQGGAAASRPTSEVVTPFGLSMGSLEAAYNRITGHIRHRVTPTYLSTEKVERMFCTARGFYFGDVEVPQLGFDELVEYYNPFCGDAEPIDELGSDMPSHLMLLAWFAGETVSGVDWTPAANFTTEKNGQQVKMFDLKDKIYTCVKHQINSVFDRRARDSCVRVRHTWNPATLTFTTVMSLKKDRELFVGGMISNTHAAITAKVDAAREAESVNHYKQIVSVFVNRVQAAAAKRGYKLPTMDDNEIEVFAEFYMEAETTGSYKLNPNDTPVPITSTEVMERLCKYLDVNLSVDEHGRIFYTARRCGGAAAGAGGGPAYSNVGHGVECAMAGGKEFKHQDVAKTLKA